MKPQIIIFLAVGLLTGALMLLDYQHGARPEASSALPETPQGPLNLSLSPVDGAVPVEVSSFRGRYVLVNAWASWCPPCVAEFPDLLALAAKHPNRLQLVTLSADRTPDKAKQFLQQFNAPPANVLHAYDGELKVIRDALQIYRYPESLLIDPSGQVVRKYAGVLSQADQREISALSSAAE